MLRKVPWFIAALLACSAIAWRVGGASASQDLTKPETITFGASPAGTYVEHNGKRGGIQEFHEGDQRTMRYSLGSLGYGVMFCDETRPRLMLCSAAFRLTGKGEVTVGGVWTFGDKNHTLAVTGGTGLYQNARGTASIVDLGFQESLVVTLHLIP